MADANNTRPLIIERSRYNEDEPPSVVEELITGIQALHERIAVLERGVSYYKNDLEEMTRRAQSGTNLARNYRGRVWSVVEHPLYDPSQRPRWHWEMWGNGVVTRSPQWFPSEEEAWEHLRTWAEDSVLPDEVSNG